VRITVGTNIAVDICTKPTVQYCLVIGCRSTRHQQDTKHNQHYPFHMVSHTSIQTEILYLLKTRFAYWAHPNFLIVNLVATFRTHQILWTRCSASYKQHDAYQNSVREVEDTHQHPQYLKNKTKHIKF